jgi:hypothetical protein
VLVMSRIVSERDAIERAAQVCERRALVWGCTDSGQAVAASFRGTAAEIRALPPAEPEEPTPEMVEAGAAALWDTFRQTDLCTGPTAKITPWRDLVAVAQSSDAAALQVSVGRTEARAAYLAMRAARPAGGREGRA